jgi:3-methyladenine DNA glycosylase AlkD
MYDVKQVLDELKMLSRPDQIEGMARYGMSPEKRLGVSVPEMRKLSKKIGTNHRLALDLWKTDIPEAQMVASMIANPSELRPEVMEEWVKDFNSWDVCDQVCMNLFEKSPFVLQKIEKWARRDEEFIKRAAYALIACLAWHDKTSPDNKFEAFFPIIYKGATDPRNFVKKAVSWALRNIGKRNTELNRLAIQEAEKIGQVDSKPAKWIAAAALRELRSEPVQKRLSRK